MKKSKLLLLFASTSTAAAIVAPIASCSFSRWEITGGKTFLDGKVGEAGSDSQSWKLNKEVEEGMEVSFELRKTNNPDDESKPDSKISVDSTGQVKWESFNSKGTYSFYVLAKVGEKVSVYSKEITLNIAEEGATQAVVNGGTALMELQLGYSETTYDAWKMTIKDQVQSDVTWSITSQEGQYIEISPTDGKVTVKPGLAKGNYPITVTGQTTYSGKTITASANATVAIVTPDIGVVKGGKNQLNLCIGDQAGADDDNWKLYVNGSVVVDQGVKFYIDNPVGKIDFININENNGQISWEMPTEVVQNASFVVKATYKGINYLSDPIKVNVTQPVLSVNIKTASSTITMGETLNFECEIQLNPIAKPYKQEISWTATGGLSIVPDPNNPTKAVLSMPSTVSKQGPTDVIDSTITANVLIKDNTAGGEQTLYSKSADKVIRANFPYVNSDSVYCWGVLKETGAPKWWKLVESEDYSTSVKFTAADGTDDVTITSQTKQALESAEIYFGDNVEVVDTSFLSLAKENFNQPIQLPSHPYVIADDFLEGFEKFNQSSQDFDLEGCTNIGRSFMYGCETISSVTIPETVISVGVDFMMNCYNLINLTINCPVSAFDTDSDKTLTVDDKACEAYTTGITLTNTTTKAAFISAFPVIKDTPEDLGYYRNYSQE